MRLINKTKEETITVKQTVRFGKPCVKGTRIAIADILNLLNAGYAIADIPKQYEGVSIKDVKAALRYAIHLLGKEEILELKKF